MNTILYWSVKILEDFCNQTWSGQREAQILRALYMESNTIKAIGRINHSNLKKKSILITLY